MCLERARVGHCQVHMANWPRPVLMKTRKKRKEEEKKAQATNGSDSLKGYALDPAMLYRVGI